MADAAHADEDEEPVGATASGTGKKNLAARRR
jgi:hypothetical protein